MSLKSPQIFDLTNKGNERTLTVKDGQNYSVMIEEYKKITNSGNQSSSNQEISNLFSRYMTLSCFRSNLAVLCAGDSLINLVKFILHFDLENESLTNPAISNSLYLILCITRAYSTGNLLVKILQNNPSLLQQFFGYVISVIYGLNKVLENSDFPPEINTNPLQQLLFHILCLIFTSTSKEYQGLIFLLIFHIHLFFVILLLIDDVFFSNLSYISRKYSSGDQ